jgi:hypothetical protein
LTLAEVCDVAYLIQVEQLERQALALLPSAPFLPEGKTLSSPDEVVAEFREWLMLEPDAAPTAGDPGDRALLELLGVGGRR